MISVHPPATDLIRESLCANDSTTIGDLVDAEAVRLGRSLTRREATNLGDRLRKAAHRLASTGEVRIAREPYRQGRIPAMRMRIHSVNESDAR